jgi:hypothetical protein
MKQPHSPSAKRSSEAAFTLVEAAAAIAVIALLSIVGFAAFAGADRTNRRIMGNVAISGRLLELESMLRRHVSRIEMPFWAPCDCVEGSEAETEIAYYEGKPDERLKLSFHEGYVLAETPLIKERVGPFEGASFSVLRNNLDCPIGIALEIQNVGKKNTMKFVFSSIALKVEEK